MNFGFTLQYGSQLLNGFLPQSGLQLFLGLPQSGVEVHSSSLDRYLILLFIFFQTRKVRSLRSADSNVCWSLSLLVVMILSILVFLYYRPRMRVGKGFTPVCLCVCVCIRVITFEPLDLLT